MKILTSVFTLAFLTFLTSCGDHLNGKGVKSLSVDTGASLLNKAALDHSNISLVSPAAVADGNSLVQVKIQLKTKAGLPVANSPLKVKVSGAGNTVDTCTSTNAQGVAYCWISSYYAEYKVFQVYEPIEMSLPIQFQDDGSLVIFIGDIVSSTSVENGDTTLFSSSGSFIDSTLMEDSNSNWVLASMHGILHSRGY